MAKDHPRIKAQKDILEELLEVEFDSSSYDGQFIDNRWTPRFHYLQGLENYRQVIQEKLWELEKEEAKWMVR